MSYAQHVTASNDNANGAGLGLVNVFDVQGTLQHAAHPRGRQAERAVGHDARARRTSARCRTSCSSAISATA